MFLVNFAEYVVIKNCHVRLLFDWNFNASTIHPCRVATDNSNVRLLFDGNFNASIIHSCRVAADNCNGSVCFDWSLLEFSATYTEYNHE